MESKKKIIITQQVRELVFDIQNKSHLTGRAREAGGGSYESSSNMQVNDDSENDYQIKRSLANSFAFLKNYLGEYLDEDSTTNDNLIDATIDDDGALTLIFQLPSNFNSATVDNLGNDIHSYMVDIALAEWFAITSKEDSSTYISRSAIALDNIKRALYRRSRPSRPTYKAESNND